MCEKYMNNVVTTLAPLFFIGSSSLLHVTRSAIKALMSLKFGKIKPETAELAALQRLKHPYRIYNGRFVVTTLVTSFLMNLIHSFR